MGPKNSACKSGLAVESGVVKSEKINIVKAYKILGPWHQAAKSEKLLNQVPIRQYSTVFVFILTHVATAMRTTHKMASSSSN